MSTVTEYSRELGDTIADRWNRFWFQPNSTGILGLLRIGVGLCGLWFLFGFTFDLVQWFGEDGVVSLSMLRAISIGEDSIPYRLSWFYLSESPAVIWSLHALACVIMVAFTLGWKTRFVAPLALFAVLSYVHRVPILSGQFEPVLCMALFYLAIGHSRLKPSECSLSLDAFLANRKGGSGSGWWVDSSGVMVNVAIRLVQIHLVGFYLVMLFTQVSGETWWIGESVWSLMASSESRLIDFSGFGRSSLLINLWSYEILLFEASFAVLIWVRVFRPLLIALSVLHWIGIVLLTGYFDFAMIMVLANAAFLSPAWVKSRFGR